MEPAGAWECKARAGEGSRQSSGLGTGRTLRPGALFWDTEAEVTIDGWGVNLLRQRGWGTPSAGWSLPFGGAQWKEQRRPDGELQRLKGQRLPLRGPAS